MKPEQAIQKFSFQPITHQLLISLLKDYKRPNDKINEWVKQRKLITLKRGLYVWNSPQFCVSLQCDIISEAPTYGFCHARKDQYGRIRDGVHERIFFFRAGQKSAR